MFSKITRELRTLRKACIYTTSRRVAHQRDLAIPEIEAAHAVSAVGHGAAIVHRIGPPPARDAGTAPGPDTDQGDTDQGDTG